MAHRAVIFATAQLSCLQRLSINFLQNAINHLLTFHMPSGGIRQHEDIDMIIFLYTSLCFLHWSTHFDQVSDTAEYELRSCILRSLGWILQNSFCSWENCKFTIIFSIYYNNFIAFCAYYAFKNKAQKVKKNSSKNLPYATEFQAPPHLFYRTTVTTPLL